MIEEVRRNAGRPQGVRGLRPAGAPERVRLTRPQLDELQEREPETYQRLIERNPEIQRYHLGG